MRAPPAGRRRLRARVEGTVQGVGFRPHVYRLASELELGGWVLNDERGVLLEVEGSADAVEDFLDRLSGEAPPLAAIERISSDTLEPTGEEAFRIVESESGGEPLAAVSPDMATCEEWLAEVFDPRSGVTATRSPTAPTAARASRSSAGSPTTAP